MLNFIWGLLVGIAAMIAVFWAWRRLNKTEKPIQSAELESANFNPNPNVEVKRENLTKLEDLISRQDRTTNDEVQSLLNVSDATAERYLNELEKQGKIRQIGAEAKNTYYQRTDAL